VINALDAVSERGSIWVRAVQMSRGADGKLLWSGNSEEPGFFGQGKIHSIRPPRDGKGLDPDKAAVVFTVVDNGPGISESDLPQIFDPFFTSKEPGQGTGLGLAICHAGVNALGGEIWAYSKVGEGTQLAFYLPVD
jgi:signal transduction histidine kinase